MVKNDVHRRLRSLVGDGLKEAQLPIGMGALPRLHVIVVTGFPGESRHVKLEMEIACFRIPVAFYGESPEYIGVFLRLARVTEGRYRQTSLLFTDAQIAELEIGKRCIDQIIRFYLLVRKGK